MNSPGMPSGSELRSLEVRAAELSCLYEIEELLKGEKVAWPDICSRILQVLSRHQTQLGIHGASIRTADRCFRTASYIDRSAEERVVITAGASTIGEVGISRRSDASDDSVAVTSSGSWSLAKTIASLLGQYVGFREVSELCRDHPHDSSNWHRANGHEWQIDLSLLRRTDKPLYLRISQKMLTHLCLKGIPAQQELRQQTNASYLMTSDLVTPDHHTLHPDLESAFPLDLGERVFQIAKAHLPAEDILTLVKRWIHEDKLCSLVQVLDANRSLSQISDALRRYHESAPRVPSERSAISRGIVVSLIRQFLSDQLEYINVAKKYIQLDDFCEITGRVISSSRSHGKVGGKAACLFLASKIVQRLDEALPEVRTPRTWYVASDMMLRLTHYNGLYEIAEHKYKEPSQIQEEYPHIVETLRRAQFPPELVNGLSAVLDEFGEVPLVVRSSSLLEDRLGVTFSGKYDSFFLANQGTRQERLMALVDAIARVYASTFAPEPIAYRAKLGLLDFSEEMGIMIQEAVGMRIQDYFLPLFSGIACSQLPRERDAISLKIIPGLKARVFDVSSDDFFQLHHPFEAAESQQLSDWLCREIPDKIDAYNLKRNRVESVDCRAFLCKHGKELLAFGIETESSQLENLRPLHTWNTTANLPRVLSDYISKGRFPHLLQLVIGELKRATSADVRIQFASDGTSLFMLQFKSSL